jgi:hypothetical protein
MEGWRMTSHDWAFIKDLLDVLEGMEGAEQLVLKLKT